MPKSTGRVRVSKQSVNEKYSAPSAEYFFKHCSFLLTNFFPSHPIIRSFPLFGNARLTISKNHCLRIYVCRYGKVKTLTLLTCIKNNTGQLK